MARAFAVRRSIFLIAFLFLAACGGGGSPSSAMTTPDTPTPEPTSTPKPTSTPEPPRAVAAGDPGTPGVDYPTRWATGEIAYGEQAMNLIVLPGMAERAAFEATLASMGTGAPTAERVLALNTTDEQNPSWTYVPGNGQKLFVAVVREGVVEKIDPSLHDWRVSNVPGVEMVRWQEVTPPPGSDNLRLIANGTTTVIGAYQGDTLVYWLSTEANNGQGDWLPNDSNLPQGAGAYHFDNDLNTWVAEAGGVTFEYRGGQWMEVVPTPEPTPEAYGHITLAPDGSTLQEYLITSGARIEPAIHIGNGAFELVPAGEVLPTHIYEPETGSWRAVDRDKAIIDRVSTSTWFVATGSPGTLYEGLAIPMRVTTTDVLGLRGIEYSKEIQEVYMVNWLQICHLAHTYQNVGHTVDFETYVEMLRTGDTDAQIYVYSYNLNPDGTRGGLRQQMLDPLKGVTIQAVYDREFEHHPLATVVNPNNTGSKFAFMLDTTEVGQANVVANVDADWYFAATEEDKVERMTHAAIAAPFDEMQWVAMYSTSHAMLHPDVNSAHFTRIRKDMNAVAKAANDYLRELLGIGSEYYPPGNLVEISYD